MVFVVQAGSVVWQIVHSTESSSSLPLDYQKNYQNNLEIEQATGVDIWNGRSLVHHLSPGLWRKNQGVSLSPNTGAGVQVSGVQLASFVSVLQVEPDPFLNFSSFSTLEFLASSFSTAFFLLASSFSVILCLLASAFSSLFLFSFFFFRRFLFFLSSYFRHAVHSFAVRRPTGLRSGWTRQ